MESRSLRKTIAVTGLILALTAVMAVAMAGSLAQGPASEGAVNAEGGSAGPAGEAGLEPSGPGGDGPLSELQPGPGSQWEQFFSEPQPDMDGYSGPIPLEADEDTPASEPDTGTGPNWDQFFMEPQPDEDEYYTAETSPQQWSTFYYVFAAGSTLRPRESNTGWVYEGYGCVSAAVATWDYFTVHLDLPEGSRVDYLRLYYYDTSAGNSLGLLTDYDGTGGFDELIPVWSTGNSGYGTSLSAYSGHIVNNYDHSYALIWGGDLNPSLWLCGLRVAYRLHLD